MMEVKNVIKFFAGNIPDIEKGMAELKSENIICSEDIYLEALRQQEEAKHNE